MSKQTMWQTPSPPYRMACTEHSEGVSDECAVSMESAQVVVA